MKKGCMLTLIFIWIIFLNKNLSVTAETEQNKNISIQWISNPEHVHYSQPVIAEIYNGSETDKDYFIPSGTLLLPSDENCQVLVLTKTLKGKIASGKLIKLDVNAMCTQNSKAGGYKGLHYQSLAKSDSVLTELAKFIEANKYFNSEAQLAVWAWMNKSGIEDIYGADTIACLALQQKLAQLTHITVPTQLRKQDYKRNYYAPSPPKTSIGGNFEYQLSKPREVSIGMFNENGVLVRELFKQKNVTPGKHRFDYEFDAATYNEDAYNILFILDGKIILKQPLALKEWKDDFMNQNSR